jgi:5-methylcytosine-specific restriction protein A
MPKPLQELTAQNAGAWSEDELTCAVKAYLRMLHDELGGNYYSKAVVNRQLREGPLAGRTKASIEFRMQNISAALYELNIPRIAGYLPARNIGSAVKEKIIAVLNRNGIGSLSAFVPTSELNALAERVSALRVRHLGKIPCGTETPGLVASTTSTFVRDPAVKAWVLQFAKGVCEGCDHPSPFLGQDGLPYLELHHVTPLSSNGSDRTTNAAALCPNCHRRCHFSADRDEFKLELYRKIPRLVLEVPEPPYPQTDEFIHIT